MFEKPDKADKFRIIRTCGELLRLLLDEFESGQPVAKRINVGRNVGGLRILEIKNACFVGIAHFILGERLVFNPINPILKRLNGSRRG